MSWCFSAILLHEGSALARICRRLIYLIQEEEPIKIGSQKLARQKLMSPLDDDDALTAEFRESGLCKNPAQREEAVRIQVPENPQSHDFKVEDYQHFTYSVYRDWLILSPVS